MNRETADQYVLALVAMKDADAERVPDNSIRGKTWLQKIMYIASKMYGDNRFGFRPHKHGVHSSIVDDSVTRCSKNGLICVHHPDGDGAIHITDKGRKVLDPDKCDDNMLRQMQSTKTLLNSLDYREMIVYAYGKFPEMREGSEIVEDFESWRLDKSTSMYLKGSVSLALAATISGLGREGFEDHLRRGGIEPYTPLVHTTIVMPMKRPEF